MIIYLTLFTGFTITNFNKAYTLNKILTKIAWTFNWFPILNQHFKVFNAISLFLGNEFQIKVQKYSKDFSPYF